MEKCNGESLYACKQIRYLRSALNKSFQFIEKFEAFMNLSLDPPVPEESQVAKINHSLDFSKQFRNY